MDVLPLIGIALIAGIVTAISPCVLPMLPVVFAGTATGSRLRPYVVVAGLVVSFSAFTLAATLLLGALGLPADFLRNLAIGVVFVLAAVLLVGRVANTAGRPFHVLARRRTTDLGGGLLLGMSLGLLFIPCAGPIIAAIAVVAATRNFSAEAVLITLAYAVGAGLVLLAIALAAHHGLNLVGIKARASGIRRGLGVVVLTTGVIMILGLDARLASNVPGYTHALQGLEQSAATQDRIARVLTGPAEMENRTVFDAGRFSDFGPAPDFRDIALWLNSEPLSLGELRGKVVLVDFWTYSCVNCLRTLPHLKRWDETYRDSGLVIVGVHSPEFAFERTAGNVRDAVADLDIEYSVALDNGFSTWKAWDNRFWPTKYIVDKRGHLRFFHFGEGAYEDSENVIRTLLAEGGDGDAATGRLAAYTEDATPRELRTPELYLGYERLENHVGSVVEPDEEATYKFAESLPLHGLTFGGRWTVEPERSVAGMGARIRLRFQGGAAHLVLGNGGEPKNVEVLLNGEFQGVIRVTDYKLYTVAETGDVRTDPALLQEDNLLELRMAPGTEAYAFTFGVLPGSSGP